jgi:hypothetical protein
MIEQPPLPRSQLKGRAHIKYLNELATWIWVKRGFDPLWSTCLKEAFEKHKKYLETDEKP